MRLFANETCVIIKDNTPASEALSEGIFIWLSGACSAQKQALAEQQVEADRNRREETERERERERGRERERKRGGGKRKKQGWQC